MVDASEQMWGAALELLGRREHGRRELAAKLAQRCHVPVDDPRLGACLDRLVEEGYQSDERYAEVFVRSRRSRGYGPSFIEQELRQRGVPAELVARAVDRAGSDWLALAGEVKRKKFGAAPVTALPEKAKVIRFLRYRGFLQSQVDAALR